MPNGKSGSGLTMIVGPNNAGKSTIVEGFTAISRTAPPSFTEGKRNKLASDRVSIRVYNSEGENNELRTLTGGGSETSFANASMKMPSIFVLPSRRTFNPYFGKATATRGEYLTNFPYQERRSPANDYFHTRLFNIQKDERNRKTFDDVLRRVLDPTPEWNIDQSDSGQYYVKLRYRDSYHSSEGLGEGLISVLFIVDALYDSTENDVIVIDEPELSLHPSLQKKLVALLAEYAATRQVVYATHSPYFVSWDALLNGGKVVRVTKQDDSIRLFSPSSTTMDGIRGLLRDQNNPHILGLDAREVFFLEDGIILVEGQEDVVFYRRIAEQLNRVIGGSFYGWGVGGADKMPIIARLLSELGFERVVGILDKNKEDRKENLQRGYPSFHFFVIPADDVRTKPLRKETSPIDGLLDEDGRIRDDFRQAITEIFDSIDAALVEIEGHQRPRTPA